MLVPLDGYLGDSTTCSFYTQYLPTLKECKHFYFFHIIILTATKEPEDIKLVYSCKAPQIYCLDL